MGLKYGWVGEWDLGEEVESHWREREGMEGKGVKVDVDCGLCIEGVYMIDLFIDTFSHL